jgi:hypothetical protein
MNQLIVAGVGALLVGAGGVSLGWKLANNARDSQELAIAKGAEAAREAALKVVVDLPKKFIPIKGDLRTEIRYETRYVSADCSHPDAVWMHLQRAYEAAGGQWPGDRVQPAGAPAGPDAGRDD